MAPTNATVYERAIEIALITLGDPRGFSQEELEVKALERACAYTPILECGGKVERALSYIYESDIFIGILESIEKDDHDKELLVCDITRANGNHETRRIPLPQKDTLLGRHARLGADQLIGKEVEVRIGALSNPLLTDAFLDEHAGCAVAVSLFE